MTSHLLHLLRGPAAAIVFVVPILSGCDCNSGTPAGACPTACATGTYCCRTTQSCQPEQRVCANLQSCPAGQLLTYPDPPYMDENTCQPIAVQCSCRTSQLSPGMVGRFSALASAGGTLMTSAYESRYGDLVLATVKTDGLDASPALEIVDGVPSVAPTKPATDYRGGIEAPGDDVGQDTDIVVGADGQPIIAYRDVTHRSLKVAIRGVDGTWKNHVVDKPQWSQDVVGRYASMILQDGKPAIVYLALNIPGAVLGTFTSELRWAVAASASPQGSTDWALSVIESKPMSCQNLCASSEVCVPNPDGTSTCQTPATGCPTCPSDQACVAGACTKVLANVTTEEIPKASGLWPAAVRTSAGALVVYYDRTAGQLQGAALSGGSWQTKTLAGTSTQDVGAFPAATCDGGATVHVIYQDAAKLALDYLQVDASSLVAGSPEVVDDGLRSDGTHPVGADGAIILDASGAVRVVYQDALRSDLLAATRTGPGEWTPKVSTDPDLGRSLEGGPKAYGFYSDLVLEGGQVYGSTFFYDAQGTPKGGLTFFALP